MLCVEITQRIKALTIRNPEAQRLAAAIANETGETITEVVIQALRERFERLPERRCKASLGELRAIAQCAAAQVKRPYLNHAKVLYNKHGLPK